jgi:hypothetical protein
MKLIGPQRHHQQHAHAARRAHQQGYEIGPTGARLTPRSAESSGNRRASSSLAGPSSESSSSGSNHPRQRPKHVDQGAQRQPRVSQLNAAPGQNPRTRVSSTRRRFRDQPCLADPASPPTITTAGSRSIADSSAATMLASSDPRPTNTGLTRPGRIWLTFFQGVSTMAVIETRPSVSRGHLRTWSRRARRWPHDRRSRHDRDRASRLRFSCRADRSAN